MNSCYFGTKGIPFYDVKCRPEVLAGQDHRSEPDALSTTINLLMHHSIWWLFNLCMWVGGISQWIRVCFGEVVGEKSLSLVYNWSVFRVHFGTLCTFMSVGHVFAYLYTLDDDSQCHMDYETSLLPKNLFLPYMLLGRTYVVCSVLWFQF